MSAIRDIEVQFCLIRVQADFVGLLFYDLVRKRKWNLLISFISTGSWSFRIAQLNPTQCSEVLAELNSIRESLLLNLDSNANDMSTDLYWNERDQFPLTEERLLLALLFFLQIIINNIYFPTFCELFFLGLKSSSVNLKNIFSAIFHFSTHLRQPYHVGLP